jgi:dienelactone hydrolase/predicted Ser/Thr protein kinase
LKIGDRLGPYAIVGQLGAGGMGIVYRASDERLGRDVAIKVVSPGLLIDEASRRRFRQEARALARLSHPNIAAVYDVGEQDGTDYLVMEYVPGISLAHKLKSGPLSATEAFTLGAEVASALEEAHERSIVHRDLKPGNIIITPKGRAKVLDFGLAKLLGTAEDLTQSLPESHGPVGTPLYMSPEQAEGKPVDSRTDLWSLGVVLYESLSGRAPFQGDSALAILRSVTQESPKPLRQVRADTPEDADRIVSRALEKNLASRYQSASDMHRDLSLALTRLTAPVPSLPSGRLQVSRAHIAAVAIVIAFLVAGGAWFYHRSERRHWAREEAIPAIAGLKARDKSLAAFLLLREAEQLLPADPQLVHLERQDTQVADITSSPSGATVEIQDYLSPDGPWFRVGTTPMKQVRIPRGYFRWRVSKPGVGGFDSAPLNQREMNFALDKEVSAPPGMSWVEGEEQWGDLIDFIGWIGPYNLPPFFIDRFEVTNRQYQEFVDQGGYKRREFWKHRFSRDGHEFSWDQAMFLFRDRSGRAGPSTWEGGHYPEGQADYPVGGVSWYEAAAYGEFAGKSLPALPQWFLAAPPYVGNYTVQASNISRSAVAPAGTFKGLGPYGTYDMAGNVREWVLNATTDNLHFLLGGAWNSQTYLYADPEALPDFDRSNVNGFRCVRNTTPLASNVTEPIKTMQRDFAKVKPASDEVFRAYRAMYSYTNTPLDAKAEGVVRDAADWREEKISFNAAYGNERMAAYLFLPKRVRPPFQTVVFFPSARVLDLSDSSNLGDKKFFDYVIESGRAVLYPIYYGTYERRRKLALPDASQAQEYFTRRFKDLSRSIDYLQTRPDIDKEKIAYLGVSMGAAEGVIYTALLQDRLKTVVLLDGGFFLDPPTAGADQADFAPRIKKPVLMVNGRYDFTFSLERAQNPLFRMLGSPDSDKRHIVLDTPHDVSMRRDELVPNVLGWLDKYLGRVE